MKVVLDTNVLISATLWAGSEAQKLLYRLLCSETEIHSTAEILDEFRKVLKRDFEYDSWEAENILKTLSKFLILVEPKQRVSVIKDDPDDNKIIECALEAKATLIITYDKHLLRIKAYHDIKILKPEEAGL